LEENKELAGNRLNELEELRHDLQEVTTQNEKLKVRCLYLSEDEDVHVACFHLSCCVVSLGILILLFCTCCLYPEPHKKHG